MALMINWKKASIILILSLITNLAISQEIHSEYLFIKEKSRSKSGTIKWKNSDTEQLILHENKSFQWTKSYQYHEVIYSELKGDWKIEKDILYLNIKQEKKSKSDKNWTETDSIVTYKVKRQKIKPNGKFDIYAAHNLKRVKK